MNPSNEPSQFKLHSEYQPTGDQPQAIAELVEGFRQGNQFETLLGVTGSGKTFTMANVIQALNKPTLIIAHNKTLAGQLYGEMKEFFPENAVEYFVSYYDYYQPEAYVPQTDTYIAKDSSINDEIDKLRLSATASLAERRDVVVVASVSCIYGLGSPDEYQDLIVSLRPGMVKDRDEVLRELIDIQYNRNDMDIQRATFRVRGDVVEVYPAQGGDYLIRIEFFGDEIDRIAEVEPLTGKIHAELNHVAIFPASHYVVSQEKIKAACDNIEEEMKERVQFFKGEDKLIEAQRIAERTNFDIEMLRETGFCSGIENYSRHLNGLPAGAPPMTLLDFFPDDFLIIVDESHMTIPQIRGMYAGDRSRKQTLVDYGFRLPSALDNRPLNFEEFEAHIDQMMFVSATPSDYEKEHELLRTEQIIRPTGLLDPMVEVRPVDGQIDDLVEYLTKIIQFIRGPEIILYIDTNNHIGSHSPGYVRGEVVFHSSVNQYLVAHTNGREYAGNSHTGTHSGSQYTIVKHYFFTVHNVLGDTSKRNRQLVEVNGIVIAYSQFGEKITQVLPFNDPSEHIRLQILFQRNRKNISFRILPFSHRLIFPTDTVTQQKRPILVIDHTIKLTGGISDGIKSADDRPHTGTYDIVDRNTCFLNHFEGTDMGYPLCSSPT